MFLVSNQWLFLNYFVWASKDVVIDQILRSWFCSECSVDQLAELALKVADLWSISFPLVVHVHLSHRGLQFVSILKTWCICLADCLQEPLFTLLDEWVSAFNVHAVPFKLRWRSALRDAFELALVRAIRYMCYFKERSRIHVFTIVSSLSLSFKWTWRVCANAAFQRANVSHVKWHQRSRTFDVLL